MRQVEPIRIFFAERFILPPLAHVGAKNTLASYQLAHYT